MNKLRLPAINAPTPEGKLEQLRSHLFQMTEYLNRLPEQWQEEAESTQSLFNRLKPVLLRSSELANAVANQIQKTFIQKKQLETERFALQGSLNGLHIHSIDRLDTRSALLLQTKFSAFSQGDGSQLFFLFGMDGGKPFQRVLRVDQSGTWEADGPLTLQVSNTPGALSLQLQQTEDRITVLSPEGFQLSL